jgi:quaternary ammonium compound-resistance protein SugE
MAWLFLFAAGICEVMWAIGLKTYGFTRTLGGAGTVVIMLLSFVLLDRAMRTLPLGTSYAIWTGIGAVGTVIYGMIALNEPRDWPRVLCIVLVLGGIVGLKVLAPRGE